MTNTTINNACRNAALWLYYHAALPARRRRNRHLAAAAMSPAMVVFYHRVADDQATPWTMSPDEFRWQIDWLAGHYELVSLEETQRRIATRVNRKPSVSVTFDDGYAANCQHALPLLVQRGIPCTYFVSTDHVLTGKPFAHDRELGATCPPNTLEELRSLVRDGVEIGAHTRTHADLGAIHHRDALEDEIVRAGVELAEAVNAEVRYFAFPFGQHENLSAEAFEIARSAGYRAVCSAYGGYNFPGDDAFHLQRFCAEDLLRLKNWTTLDRRKMRVTPRYQYAPADGELPSDSEALDDPIAVWQGLSGEEIRSETRSG